VLNPWLSGSYEDICSFRAQSYTVGVRWGAGAVFPDAVGARGSFSPD